MPRMPPPYVEAGPDGRQYYVLLGVPRHLVELYTKLVTASEVALKRRDPSGRAQSLAIDILLRELQTMADQIGIRTASYASKQVRHYINSRRIRPVANIQGASAGARLVNGVESRPLPMVFPRGSTGVGVADISALEAATKSRHPSPRTKYPYYWRSQEDGSAAMVGRTLYGAFQPGLEPPSGPPFNASSFEIIKGGHKMVIKRAVQAKNFIKDGAGDAHVFRSVQLKELETFAIEEMRFIASGNHPTLNRIRASLRPPP